LVGQGAAVEKLKSNPFEQRNNSRAKHLVLGRRLKGENRNVAMARSKVNQERSFELLLRS
jgi:hypothetical protein